MPFFAIDVAARPLQMLHRKRVDAVIVDEVCRTFRAPREQISPDRHRELTLAARSARRFTVGRAVGSIDVLGLVALYIAAAYSRGQSRLFASLLGAVIAWLVLIDLRTLLRMYRAITGLVASSRVG